MKKVLILSLGRKGGCVIYGREIINNFSIDYDLYVSEFCQEEFPNKSIKIKTYKSKIGFLVATLSRLPILSLKVLIGLFKNRYSAFYTPYFHFWNIFIIILFKIFKKKVVITVHDGILHDGDGELFEQTLNIWCIKLADEIIFLTHYVKDLTKSKIGFKAKPHVIPHGLIIPKNIKCSLRKHPSDGLRLLFLGRINKYKGVELLIEAFQMLPSNLNCSLTIAGKTSYELNIKNPRVTLIDKFLTDDEIAKLLISHDVLILPYLEATQSGVITLGISSAIPMICTNVGGLREQLGEENGIFVNVSSLEITNAIIELYKNDVKYEQLSKNMVLKSKSLQWDEIARDIEKVLEDK